MTEFERYLHNAAAFYGITVEEAERRVAVCVHQGNNPDDPICIGCARRSGEIPVYAELAEGEGCSAREYVLHYEGTLNTANGHFLCDECYLRNGMPTSSGGWVTP